MNTSLARIALTGATGYLGGHLAKFILERGGGVLALTRRPAACLSGSAGYREASLERPDDELARVLADFAPTALVHTAALSTPPRCEADPVDAQRSNVNFTARMLRISPCKVLTVSTDLVFEGGRAPAAGFREDDNPAPVSVYARTKAAAERLTLGASPLNSVVRVSLLFGKPIGDRAGALGWMQRAVAEGKPLELFSDEFRSPSYVADVVRNLCVLAAGDFPGVYHCSCGTRVSRVEFGRAFLEAHKLHPARVIELTRAQRPAAPPRAEDVTLCADKLRAISGTSFHTIASAMAEITNSETKTADRA